MRMPIPEVLGLLCLLKALITSPRTVLLPAVITSPFAGPAMDPLNSMIGLPVKPGWVVPSIVTGSVIVGRADVGAIVYLGPERLKTIMSAPALALASRMACLSEPGPLSLVLVTVKVIGARVITAVGTTGPFLRITKSLSASMGSRATGAPDSLETNPNLTRHLALLRSCGVSVYSPWFQ